ncbi:hypothetical protein L6452_24946 [Arctium lappa]|uniref:Uncharacterized protein n=1 Tax=Arctium lappa TaxID=4217 RepID=A0ACB9AA74_ARCLA|nr:hypothetical protein L6452_24946 [Arctium lappa]
MDSREKGGLPTTWNLVIETPQPKAKYAHLINTIGQDGANLSLQEPKTSSAEDLSVLRAEDLSVFRSRRSLRQPKTS